MVAKSTVSDERWYEKWAVVWDVVMLVLIIANLGFILFDWLFINPWVQSFFQQTVPDFFVFYRDRVHEHFFWYDLAFITIFVLDVLVGWIVAIVRQRYHRWFYYPFVHWYDVLGCIPIGSLRVLRILRVFTMMRKMQALDFVDLRQTYPYEVFQHYVDIVTEEISDRVVVKMLSGVQAEVRGGSHVTGRILREVVEPKRQALVATLSERLQRATAETYALYQEDVRRYVRRLVADALEENRELRTIQQMPMIGKTVSTLLERAISDIVFNVINDLVDDIAADENNPVIAHVTDISSEALLALEGEQFNKVTAEMIDEALEIVKEQVRVRQWKKQQTADTEGERAAHEMIQPV